MSVSGDYCLLLRIISGGRFSGLEVLSAWGLTALTVLSEVRVWGTFETCRPALAISASGGEPEVMGRTV
jgi:hypothetical protein